jgi:hypothetical protein
MGLPSKYEALNPNSSATKKERERERERERDRDRQTDLFSEAQTVPTSF